MGYQLSSDAAPGTGGVHGMKIDFHHISAHYKIGLADHFDGLCTAGNLFSESVIFFAAEVVLHLPRSILGCYDKTLLT